MSNEKSEPELSVDAFVNLLVQSERQLYTFILSLVPNWSDADEIAQQVRVSLWEQFSEYDPTKDFNAWARSKAYYFILTYRKNTKRNRELLDVEYLQTIAQRFENTDEDLSMRRKALEKCMQELSESNRKLIAQYYESNSNRQQIALDQGRSYQALRQSIQRIRNILSRCIGKKLSQSE